MFEHSGLRAEVGGTLRQIRSRVYVVCPGGRTNPSHANRIVQAGRGATAFPGLLVQNEALFVEAKLGLCGGRFNLTDRQAEPQDVHPMG